MDNINFQMATKIGAYTTLFGSLCMITGAILLVMSGADLDVALDTSDLDHYLVLANSGKLYLIANLSIWICGVVLLGLGVTMMTVISSRRPVMAKIVLYNYWIAIPIVVVAYSAWLAVVVRLSADSTQNSAVLAEVVGWFASRADWIATVLVLGTGPLLISLAGRKDWVPRWLHIWSYITLFTGLLNVIAMYAGGLTTYGFLIIPLGMGWMIAASIVLFKRIKTV